MPNHNHHFHHEQHTTHQRQHSRAFFIMASALLNTFRMPLRFKGCMQAPIAPRSCVAQRQFSQTTIVNTTYNQVLRGCRVGKKARKPVSPALVDRPQMKGVCLRVGIQKPKKPNSGERKIARIRLSNGKVVTAYIPGEGHNIQQHSVVLARGGRVQDCNGVKYKLVRGHYDLVSIRIWSMDGR